MIYYLWELEGHKNEKLRGRIFFRNKNLLDLGYRKQTFSWPKQKFYHYLCFICLSESTLSYLLSFLFRNDGNQNNLRSAAYEALMELVKNSPKDCYVTVQKTTMVILERLQRVLQMEVSPGRVYTNLSNTI